MGWVQEDRVWQGRPAEGAVMLNLRVGTFTPSWLQGWGYHELFLSEEPSGGHCWRGQCAEFPPSYCLHWPFEFLKNVQKSWISIFSLPTCTLWENQAPVVSTHENPTSHRGSLKYWRHILGRGSTSSSGASLGALFSWYGTSMFIMKWNETFC